MSCNEVTFHARVAWIPDPPLPPIPPPQPEAGQQLAQTSQLPPDSPLSPPPADLDLDTTLSQSHGQEAVSSPEESSSNSQDIPIPKTAAELWTAVITRAKQRFDDDKNNDEYFPSTGKAYEGPLMHHKIKWPLAQLMALIALGQDDSVQGYTGFGKKRRRWADNPQKFHTSLDTAINKMMEDMAQMATIWMQAKDQDTSNSKSTSATASATTRAQAVASSSNPGGPSDKGKGKAKAIAPVKRSAEESAERPDAAKKQRQGQEQKERDEKDKAAQEKVREWYDNVSLLTGHGLSDGAHIFSVSARARSCELFNVVDHFWPEDKVQQWEAALDSDENRMRNILPMEPTAHKMFDRFLFALRPVRCPVEPKKRMYLQLDCQLSIDPNAFERRDSRPENLRLLSNYRVQTEDGQGPRYLEHGQVLEIASKDEAKLPSYEILEVTYALTRVIGALKGAGLLQLVFRGDPPDVDPVPAEEAGVRLPPFQEVLLEAALEAGVFTREQAPKWRAAALVQEAAEEAAENERQIEFGRAAGFPLKGNPLAAFLPKEKQAEEREEEDEEEEAEEEEEEEQQHGDANLRSKATRSN